MFRHIVIPVDLVHADKLDRAIRVAADLSRHYQATATLVGVTTSAPGEVAHTPEEFADKLQEFAGARSDELDVQFRTHAATTPDAAVDLEKVLNRVVHELKADLVVMASHVPGFRDHFFSSHSGYLASHTDVSVFIVR